MAGVRLVLEPAAGGASDAITSRGPGGPDSGFRNIHCGGGSKRVVLPQAVVGRGLSGGGGW